jgi:hypothetical protein
MNATSMTAPTQRNAFSYVCTFMALPVQQHEVHDAPHPGECHQEHEQDEERPGRDGFVLRWKPGIGRVVVLLL